MATTILVVEDNPDSAQLMGYLLRSAGYEPLIVATGREGLRAVEAAEPDLVLLDIQLPDIDGFEVIEAIQRGMSGEVPPVVAVTAFAMVGDRERVLRTGFDGFITKPISPESFIEDVESFLPEELRSARVSKETAR